MSREAQIVYSRGVFWVSGAHGQYTVYEDGPTCARADSSYPKTDDGRSLAVARVDYLSARREGRQ